MRKTKIPDLKPIICFAIMSALCTQATASTAESTLPSATDYTDADKSYHPSETATETILVSRMTAEPKPADAPEDTPSAVENVYTSSSDIDINIILEELNEGDEIYLGIHPSTAPLSSQSMPAIETAKYPEGRHVNDMTPLASVGVRMTF